MRILVASDSHGNIDNLMENLKGRKFDFLFYLGDYVRDGIEIAKILDIPYKIVRGNGDWNVKGFADDEIFKLGDKKIFLTHGHKYNVSYSMDNIYYRAKELEADYVFFGHTHVPIIREMDNILFINPGSTRLPRSRDRQASFAIVEIGEKEKQEIIKINGKIS